MTAKYCINCKHVRTEWENGARFTSPMCVAFTDLVDSRPLAIICSVARQVNLVMPKCGPEASSFRKRKGVMKKMIPDENRKFGQV